MIEFSIPLAPVPQGRPRVTKRGWTYTPEKSRKFRDDFQIMTRRFLPEKPLDGALEVYAVFTLVPPKKPKHKHPIGRPDIDNLLKAICDALNPHPPAGWPGMWLDDSQVVKVTGHKQYALPGFPPEIRITVMAYGQEER